MKALLGFIYFYFVFLLLPLSAQPVAEITVDFNREIERVNPYIFGHNTLAYDPCLHRRRIDKFCRNRGRFTNFAAGQWDPLLRRPNAVLVDLAKRIKVSVLRFPGGCGTHHYDWKKAIGPIEERPMYRFGIDEFMELCQAVGAEPIITLSYFTGTCQDLADLVEYLNAPLGTNPNGGVAWAEVRAANGHPEPYGVKWFEFGNEVWHGDHVNIPAVDPREYARRYLECRQLIKNVDRKALLGAVIKESFFGLDWWSRIVLKIIKNDVDFVILHIYRPGYRGNKISTEELFKITYASVPQIGDILKRMSFQLKDISGRNIPIAITEYNGYFAQNEPVPYRHALGNALFIADLLRVFLTVNIPVLCANYWHFSNSYWGLLYNPEYMQGRGKYYLRPNYYIFNLYAGYFGKYLLKTKVFSESYLTKRWHQGKFILETIKNAHYIPPLPASQEIISIPLNAIRLLASSNCNKMSSVYGDSLIISLNCKKFINKEPIFEIVVNNIKPYHIYAFKAEVKTVNIPWEGFRFNLNCWCRRCSKIVKWGAVSRKLFGNSTDWIYLGSDLVTFQDTQTLKVIGQLVNTPPFKGEIHLKSIVLEDLGPAPQYGLTPYISALASTNEKRNRIYLMVINKNLEEPMRTRIKINGFSFDPVVRAWVLNGPSVAATNENGRERVRIHYRKVEVKPENGAFWFTFEPHSVTALELTRREGT